MFNYQKQLQRPIVNSNGDTVLISACKRSQLDPVKMCLGYDKSSNIHINHQNKQGMSALAIASLNGDYDIVGMLLKHGAQINRNYIMLAERCGYKEVARLLQENEVNFFRK